MRISACKLSLIVLLMLTLSGCGFHLRHNQLHLGTKYPVIVLAPSGSNTFYYALHNALTQADVNVMEQCTTHSFPRLVVLSESLTQRPLVYGPDAELRRERLNLAVTFSFGEHHSQEIRLLTTRDRQLNNNQRLGDDAEKIIIEREMQTDIIDQLLRFLASCRV